jgi:argonaute-like protein implicated in RNA metabolism and viral defense
MVTPKNSSMKGKVHRILGELGDHRKRLETLTTDPTSLQFIKNAPDDELVIQVQVGAKSYDYVSSALHLICRIEDFRKFKINSQNALKELRFEPWRRESIISSIAQVLASQNLIQNRYSSLDYSSQFASSEEIGFYPKLLFGGNQKVTITNRNLYKSLKQYGLYKKSTRFANKPIRFGIINGLNRTPIESFLSNLQRTVRDLGFESQVLSKENITPSRTEISKAIDRLSEQNCDVIIAFFSQQYYIDEDENIYEIFKSISLGKGIPTQVVYQKTMQNEYAIGNIALGILGKIGNIPFILADPLNYADLVVGIDIASRRKEHLPGTINATAIARIYFGNGEFLRYVIHDAPLEGETIPPDVLRNLFPVSEFEGKRVIVHRDGYYRGSEAQVLQDWGKEINAEFNLMEIIKREQPRLYLKENTRILQPLKGSTFIISNSEALLISSPPPFTNATARPLRIRAKTSFPLKNALHSVLALTLLHYGSIRPPRLPVTIHYSDKIAGLALKGIKPKELEGTIPYWL